MSEEKKVRFNNDIETKIIENNNSSNNNNSVNNNNNNDNNNNNEDLEKQILKSIEIGNQKEREREKELKERSKIIDFKKERRYKEEVFNDRIESIEGEENYGSDDEERIKREESKKFKSTIRTKRAFRNDDEYSDEDIDDEEEGKKKDDEIEYDSFNLESEHERGYFDQTGNFVFKKEDKEQDAWLQEYDQVWSSKMPKISKRELEKQDAQQTAEEEDLWEIEHKEELKKRRLGLSDSEKSFRLETLNKIYNLLQSDKETVLSALKRLGGSGNSGNGISKRPEIKRKNPPKNKRSTNNIDTSITTTASTTSIDTKQIEENKKQFNRLTELADSLLSSGFMNIYSETKLTIDSTFKKDGYTPL